MKCLPRFLPLIVTIACQDVPKTSAQSNHSDSSVMDVGGVDAGVEDVNHPGVFPKCPGGMKHVSGKLCRKVRYKCVRGRGEKAGVSCPKGCYIHPNQCAEWLPGSMECLPTKPVRSGVKVTYEPDWVPFEFCMDEYEWPNRKGEKPRVFISFDEAVEVCRSVGKRVCTSAEFTLACEGPEGLPVGYGWKIDGTVCNVEKKWRDWTRVKLRTPAGFAEIDQSEPIGSRPLCVSPYGIWDLTGNIDEWTRLDPIDGDMSRYPSQLKGGYYASGAHPYCRAHTDIHGPEFSFYQIGTRCCGDVK